MAMTLFSNNEPLTNNDGDHLEIFSLIWLDTDDNIDDIQNTEQKLRAIINHFKRFQDANECQQYIEHKSKHDRLVLITSYQLGQEVIPCIHKLRQVSSIYIYCTDDKSKEQWINNFTKVKIYWKV